jgi:hypothetical protein
MNIRSMIFAASFCTCLWMWYGVVAQEPKPSASEPDKKTVPPKVVTPKDLRDDALAISGRYARFERMLTQMADILGRQDPERADLLRRAIGKGREDQVKEDIEKVVELLSKSELGTATEKQTEIVASLETLLKLLQSEDRRSSVEREQERLNGLLKDVRSILAEQKSARAATQNSEAPSNAAPGQQKALEGAKKTLESMKEHDDQQAEAEQGDDKEGDEGKNPDGSEESDGKSSGKSKDGKSAKGKSTEGKPGEEKKKDGDPEGTDPEGKDQEGKKKGDQEPKGDSSPDSKPGDGEPKDGESKDGKDGKSKDSGSKSQQKSSGKKKSAGKSGEKSGKTEPKQTPGREQLENAQQQMERALEELKEQEREKALEHEDEALEELHEAASELEEMLKQLREEEKEMLLASLEARFQRMLIAETQIQERTVSLAATPQKDWLDQYYGRCRELAQQQTELASECAQTVNLLREDGTSVSILLAVEDIEADMGSVSGWLQESKVGDLTQSVQNDIIESLKQLIETTQKEMQEMKEHQQESQQQQGPPQKPGLVELMAEIKMLRNLQLQVNRRTKQVDGLLQSASSEDLPSLKKQVHDLAVRQRRLIETAKELAKQSQ